MSRLKSKIPTLTGPRPTNRFAFFRSLLERTEWGSGLIACCRESRRDVTA